MSITLPIGDIVAVAGFGILGISTMILGIRAMIFGAKFRNNARETMAFVMSRTVQGELEIREHGGYSHKARYYVTLKPDVPDLPTLVTFEVRSEDYVKIEGGEMVKIFYLPHDDKHIALDRNGWGALGKGFLFIGALATIVAVGYIVYRFVGMN